MFLQRGVLQPRKEAAVNFGCPPVYHARCFEITTKEITDTDYLQRKSRYLSDKKAYDEHPDLYDRSPSFTFQYDYWLKLTEIGKQYLAWYEN